MIEFLKLILPSIHFKTIIKEHISKCVKENVNHQSKKISITSDVQQMSSNAMNRSSISEHLVKNPIREKSYEETKLKKL